MIRTLWDKILALFNKKKNVADEDLEDNERYVIDYEDNTNINFTAIFANKLANYTMSDSNIDIVGDSSRAKLFKKVVKKLKRKMKKKVIARMLGTGGVLVVPRVANRKLYFDVISQNRLSINKKIGDDITDCTILAEHIVKDLKHYYRWADYTLENGNLYIRYRSTMENSPISIKSVQEWSNIEDISITNVDRMPFMYLKSPVDNRKETDDYGVPITYGCDKQISKIMKTLDQIDREFDLKQVIILMDSTMFKGDTTLSNNGLYKKVNSGDDTFHQIFDPAFRDTPLFNKLMNECALLEKEIGTSKGILTEIDTHNATATEIKKMLKDTFDIVDDIRSSIEDGLEDFVYACDVLINYFGLAPQGEYEITEDWSYDLLEDPAQTFNQLIQGHSKSVIKDEELRQFLKPNETLEESKKIVEEIKKKRPSVKDLLGTNEGE